MDWNDLGQHTMDILKGAIGSAVTIAIVTFLQYVGTHIPDLVQWLMSTGGGVAVIKATRFHA